MNKPLFQIALALGLQLSLAASAQQPEAVQPQTQSSQIALRVPNFARGLVARWVAEYRKTNPNIDFQFVTGKSHNQENSILLTTDADGVQVARLAVLPVARPRGSRPASTNTCPNSRMSVWCVGGRTPGSLWSTTCRRNGSRPPSTA